MPNRLKFMEMKRAAKPARDRQRSRQRVRGGRCPRARASRERRSAEARNRRRGSHPSVQRSHEPSNRGRSHVRRNLGRGRSRGARSVVASAVIGSKQQDVAQYSKSGKRLKPSDLCKNADCRGKDGKRKRREVKGYCWHCVPDFVGAATLQLARDKIRQGKRMCKLCQQTPAQGGFDGFCKPCYRLRGSDAPGQTPQLVCYYCMAPEAVLTSCGWRAECSRLISVCSHCAKKWGGAVCDACWGKSWASGCFDCEKSIPK